MSGRRRHPTRWPNIWRGKSICCRGSSATARVAFGGIPRSTKKIEAGAERAKRSCPLTRVTLSRSTIRENDVQWRKVIPTHEQCGFDRRDAACGGYHNRLRHSERQCPALDGRDAARRHPL